MKFHFFTSLFLLVAAGFMVFLGFVDREIFLYAAIIEFILGIQQIFSSFLALTLLKRHRNYFIKHLIFSILFVVILFFAKGFGMDENTRWLLVFSLPWAVAIYHAYKLYAVDRG